MALVKIETFADHSIAQMARGMFMAQGIAVVLFDDRIASLGLGGLLPARLMVDEAGRPAAERLLRAAAA